jgi:hypothetical protein
VGIEGFEPPLVGLQPRVLPLYYIPNKSKRKWWDLNPRGEILPRPSVFKTDAINQTLPHFHKIKKLRRFYSSELFDAFNTLYGFNHYDLFAQLSEQIPNDKELRYKQ